MAMITCDRRKFTSHDGVTLAGEASDLGIDGETPRTIVVRDGKSEKAYCLMEVERGRLAYGEDDVTGWRYVAPDQTELVVYND